MIIIYTINEYWVWHRQNISINDSVALIATKGCLHAGHLTLAQVAKSHCQWVIITVSLHPNQFEEDQMESFPRVASQDIQLAQESGQVDVLLLLKTEEYLKYGSQHGAFVWLQSDILPPDEYWNAEIGEAEGTMLVKMLNVTKATHVYLGGNDLIRSRMIQRILTDLLYNVETIEIPTVRDDQDIAHDARLVRLSDLERSSVAVVYRALRTMVQLYLKDVFECPDLLNQAYSVLDTERSFIKPIFVRIAHPYGFHNIETIDPAIGAIAIIKVLVAGKAYHLDNVILASRIPAKEKRIVALLKNSPPR